MADPSWLLRGEGMLAWVSRPPGRRRAPAPGLASLAGPAAIVAMRYDDSPVGAYLELSVVVPARLGLRLGLYASAVVVTSVEARLAYRRNWGLPAELGELRWSSGASEERTITWDERGLSLSGLAFGPSVPAPMVPVRAVAWRPTGAVVLARRLRARVRPARCRVDVGTGDDLSWLAGPHPGLMLSGARIVAGAARRPAGLLSSVPWRDRAGAAPEPAG